MDFIKKGLYPPGIPKNHKVKTIELETALRSRRSVRKYLTTGIPDSLMNELLDLARHAPSSMNGQPCSFIVIRDQAVKERLADIKDECCPAGKKQFKADMLRRAPAIVVVCVDRNAAHERVLENGVLAGYQLMLAAHGRGLGTVFMTAYREDEPRVTVLIRELLAIPATIEPVVLLPLGYPDEVPPQKTLKPLEGLISHDKYRNV